MISPKQKIGVITAAGKRLSSWISAGHLEPIGVRESSPLVIAGLDDSKEFYDVLMEEKRDVLDADVLRADLVSLAEGLVEKDPTIGVILLECSDLPPFSAAIQRAVNLPVFDFICFINAIHRAVVQREYSGTV